MWSISAFKKVYRANCPGSPVQNFPARFEVPGALLMHIRVFWNMTPNSLLTVTDMLQVCNAFAYRFILCQPISLKIILISSCRFPRDRLPSGCLPNLWRLFLASSRFYLYFHTPMPVQYNFSRLACGCLRSPTFPRLGPLSVTTNLMRNSRDRPALQR
jgi:hypothetical protein